MTAMTFKNYNYYYADDDTDESRGDGHPKGAQCLSVRQDGVRISKILQSRFTFSKRLEVL